MILNAGCGHSYDGDVRVDVSRNSTANIIATVSCLPFRDKVFSQVIAFHVFEHLKEPQKGFRECKRVGYSLHARFPYKYDRVPYILFAVFRLSPGHLRIILHDCFYQFLTQIKISDHPIAHRWVILPFGKYQVNKMEVSPWTFLHYGRKSRYFKWLPRIMMSSEWECWSP